MFKHNQKDAKLHNGIYYYKCSTCFRRFLRPSSGAQNCIHNIRCLLSFFCFLLLLWVSWNSSSAHHQELKTVYTTSGIRWAFSASYCYCEWVGTVLPPIIRSSKLYTQHQVFVELFLLLTAIVSELEQFLRPSSGAQNGMHSIRYLSSFFCFLLLSWVSWNNSLMTGKKQKKLDKYLMLCIQFWAPDDGRRNCLKHVEHL